MSSSIFRKLLWSGFLVIASTLLVVDFYLTRYAAQQQVEAVERRLAAQARILEGELPAVANANLETWARTAGDRAQARVTVIDRTGLVLADSHHDPETMENHAGRPEIREAMNGRVGRSLRHSATLGRDLCYVAVPIQASGQPGQVLRLAVPLEQLDTAISAVHWRILGVSLVAAALGLSLAYFFSRSLTQRISRIQTFAEGLLEARFPESPLPHADDELGALARSLGRMAGQIRELVDRLSLESARRDAILASMLEGVLAVDNELRILFCNQSFARAFGARGPVVEGLPLLTLVREPELLELLTRVLVSGESVKQRLRLPATNDRSFEVQAAPLAAPSRRGAIAVLHDVTDLERLERVRKDFVANVSHELRTPLTAIRGYAETLLDGALEDKENNRKFLEIIRDHSVRLNNIASDLLVLSELESGRRTVEREKISVRAAVEVALRTVEPVAAVGGVSLRATEIEDLTVTGFPLYLEQALINLLDNAVKFNRRGGEVRVQVVRTADGQARITVADTGSGIPSEHLSRIFERFYRVDKARSRERGGTGLGLAIVKHAVERLNGTVTVESELGKGSTFTILLPCP